jgi:hypothetical protein
MEGNMVEASSTPPPAKPESHLSEVPKDRPVRAFFRGINDQWKQAGPFVRWGVFCIVGVSLAASVLLLLGAPRSDERTFYLMLDGFFIVCLSGATLLTIVQMFNERHRRSLPVIVFLVTIFSMFAFGLRERDQGKGGKSHEIVLEPKELAAIVVLYLLGELSVVIFQGLERTEKELKKQATREVGTILGLAETAKGEIEKLTHRLDGRLAEFERTVSWDTIFDVLTKLQSLGLVLPDPRGPSGREDAITVAKAVSALSRVWADHLREARNAGPNSEMIRRFWIATMETYCAEERADLGGYSSSQASRQEHMEHLATLASNEDAYLKLLTEVLEKLRGTETLRQGRPLLLRGISLLLPEYWFNWRNPSHENGTDGERSLGVFRPMDEYRKKVAQLVEEGKSKDGREPSVIFDRLVLVSSRQDPIATKHAFATSEDLLPQRDRVIVSFAIDKAPRPYSREQRSRVCGLLYGSTSCDCQHRRDGAERQCLNRQSGGPVDVEPDADKSRYAIISKESGIPPARKEAVPQLGESPKDSADGQLRFHDLVTTFTRALHSDPDKGARFAILEPYVIEEFETTLEDTIGEASFEMLLIGTGTPGGGSKPEDFFACVSTSMKPGSGALRLKVITNPEKVRTIADMWKDYFGERAMHSSPWLVPASYELLQKSS